MSIELRLPAGAFLEKLADLADRKIRDSILSYDSREQDANKELEKFAKWLWEKYEHESIE